MVQSLCGLGLVDGPGGGELRRTAGGVGMNGCEFEFGGNWLSTLKNSSVEPLVMSSCSVNVLASTTTKALSMHAPVTTMQLEVASADEPAVRVNNATA